MLYDILSPLIFFFSLGGILLILARVVIRIRRDQFSSTLKAAAATDASSSAVLAAPSSEVATLLRPDNKSVHMVKTRLAFLGYMLRQSKASIAGIWQQRHERSAAKKAVKQAEVAKAEEIVVPAPTAATPLHTRGLARVTGTLRAVQPRRFSLANVTKRFRARAELKQPAVNQAAPVAPAVVTHAHEEKTATVLTRTTIKAPVAVPAPETPAAAVAEPTPVAPERSFARSILRRSHAKAPVVPTPLEKAEAALRENRYQQAEDMLVPYIVKHPKDTEAYMLLGRAALGREAWDEGMEIFEQVLRWNPEQNNVYALLGFAAYKAGKFTRALQALQRAHDANPADRQVLDYLLSIAQKMDNRGLQHSITEEIDNLSARIEKAEARAVAAAARVR